LPDISDFYKETEQKEEEGIDLYTSKYKEEV